jgi:putative molybdopterin biosynthesis protein
MQGVVYRPGDVRFEGKAAEEAILTVKDDPACVMVNRNAGSGTRILIDRLLAGTVPPGHAVPPGYAVQPRNHNAVAAAVAQHRADWGVCIESVARQSGLGFLPLQQEHYDFIVPQSRLDRPAVKAFRELLAEPEIIEMLGKLGLSIGHI